MIMEFTGGVVCGLIAAVPFMLSAARKIRMWRSYVSQIEDAKVQRWSEFHALADEYKCYRAAAEDRFCAIAEMETPKASATVRKMASLAASPLFARQDADPVDYVKGSE